MLQKDFERRADPKDRQQAALIEEMRAHTKKASGAPCVRQTLAAPYDSCRTCLPPLRE